MEKSQARRIYAQARIAAAQRVFETGNSFRDDPTDERWAAFVRALADISRLEASPLAGDVLGSGPESAARPDDQG
jgi:hypothetical protein